MPTYSYEHHDLKSECKLGVMFDKFESIKSEPASKCEDCQQPVKRLISSGVGVIFKGAGFYANEYPKHPNKKS